MLPSRKDEGLLPKADLKERQRDERNQTGGSEECVHGAALPWSVSCIFKERVLSFQCRP